MTHPERQKHKLMNWVEQNEHLTTDPNATPAQTTASSGILELKQQQCKQQLFTLLVYFLTGFSVILSTVEFLQKM